MGVVRRRVPRAVRPGVPEVIEVAVEDLPAMRDGEALVDVEAVGLNHAETLIRSGSYVVRVPFPYPVGGEGSGTILEVDLPATAHDFFLDLIVTPEGTLRPRHRHRQPKGIRADHLTDEKRRAILALRGIGIR